MRNDSSRPSGVTFLDRPRVLEHLRGLVAARVAARSEVRQVWLFGSLARGTATPRSDVDLLIVVDRDDRRPMDRAPEFLSLLADLRRPTDVLVLTEAEWSRREGSALHREVTAHGIRLF